MYRLKTIEAWGDVIKRSVHFSFLFVAVPAVVAFGLAVAPSWAQQNTTTQKTTTKKTTTAAQTAAPKTASAATSAAQAAPCCTVTAINASTGLVTGRVNATGQSFTFTASGSVLSALKVGQGVYANFTSKQVSINGASACCSITSGAAAATPTAAAPATTVAAPASAPAATKPVATAATVACCSITGIDVGTGQVTARVNATGQTFTFTASASVLSSLNVGQGIYANFTSKQISVDGKSASGTVISGPSAASALAPAAAPPATSSAKASAAAPAIAAAPVAKSVTTATPASTSTSATASAATKVAATPAIATPLEDEACAGSTNVVKTAAAAKTSISMAASATQPPASQYCVPILNAGTPEQVSTTMSSMLTRGQPPARWEARTVTAVVGGKTTTANILHLRGLDGIQEAQGLPDAARDFLILHVKALPAGESDNYIVNVDLANEWAKTHPAPPSATPTAPASDGTAGCDSWSWHCGQEVGQHVIDQASAQANALREQAQKDYDKAIGDAETLWNEGSACFTEQALSTGNMPVEFTAKPSFGVTLTESGSTSSGTLKASGQATGKVNLAIPFGGNFKAALAVSYIPCLPFVVRPKSAGAEGDLTIGSTLTASVNANGSFDYSLAIPPNGSGLKIPVEVIPIALGPVPIAEMDISAYFEGGIDVNGSGKLTSNFELDNPHEAAFNFSCSGSGCSGNWSNVKVPTTTSENVQLSGQINVTPDVYTAVQLDFDVDALSVRSGPEPKLFGVLSGCVAASGTQTLGGSSTSAEWHLLTGDVDWELQLRTEFLLGGTMIGNPAMNGLISRTHLWYSDLWPGGSNALDAVVAAPTEVVSGKPATFNVSMPSCYPYPDKITYKVVSTDGGTEAAAGTGTSAACATGICLATPPKPFGVNVTWPSAGSQSLTVVPVGDAHGRAFNSAQPTQSNVDVQAPMPSGSANTSIK